MVEEIIDVWYFEMNLTITSALNTNDLKIHTLTHSFKHDNTHQTCTFEANGFQNKSTFYLEVFFIHFWIVLSEIPSQYSFNEYHQLEWAYLPLYTHARNTSYFKNAPTLVFLRTLIFQHLTKNEKKRFIYLKALNVVVAQNFCCHEHRFGKGSKLLKIISTKSN